MTHKLRSFYNPELEARVLSARAKAGYPSAWDAIVRLVSDGRYAPAGLIARACAERGDLGTYDGYLAALLLPSHRVLTWK